MKRVLVSLAVVVLVVAMFGGCKSSIHLPAKTDGTTTTAPVETTVPQTTQHATEAVATEAPTAIPESTTKKEISTKLTASPSSSKDVAVSKDEAKGIVLAHAGLSASDVKWYKAELDRERGGLVYEIEFDSGKYEYEYEVSAENGRILKSEKDFRD